MSTTERGYGWQHQQLRKVWAKRIARGDHINCWRCNRRILPSTPWDLGHDDTDRTQYRGPEHLTCNRSAAGQQSAAQRGTRTRPTETHPGLLPPGGGPPSPTAA